MEVFRTVRSTITHPFVAGPLGGGVIVLLAYLDSKYRNIDREKSTYWKLFIVSTLVFATITYFVSSEHTKTDEFLDQNYDTKVPPLFPSSKGGFSSGDQPLMAGPDEYVSKIMNDLPEPGTFKLPEVDPKVTMKIKPEKSYRSGSSHRSRHSGYSRRSRRSR